MLTKTQEKLLQELLEQVFEKTERQRVPSDRLFQSFCKTKRLNSTHRRQLSEAFFAFLRHYWQAREMTSSLDVWELYKTWASTCPEVVFSLSAQANLSLGLWALLKDSFATSENALEEAKALQNPAPCDLRINTFAGFTKSAVVRTLCSEGIITDELPLDGLRLLKRPALGRLALYREGAFEVQDFGSQIVTRLCPVRPGMRILDYCAGGGGKTLAFLNALFEKGRVYGEIVGTDIEANRLANARQRLARIRHFSVQAVRLIDFSLFKASPYLESFDLVVVDAPCSGLGTLRRNPDKAVFLTVEEITRLATLQSTILDQALSFVRPGGTLAYITCSVLKIENEDVVEKMLIRHPTLRSIEIPWNELFQTLLPSRTSRLGLQLTPKATQTDGLFVALLKKDR